MIIYIVYFHSYFVLSILLTYLYCIWLKKCCSTHFFPTVFNSSNNSLLQHELKLKEVETLFIYTYM